MTNAALRTQSGIALIVVLWALALLTTVAASITFTQRTEINLNRSQVEQVQARQLAQAGVAYAVYMLQLQDTEYAWQTDGELRPFQFDGRVLLVAVYLERGLVDLNRADTLLMEKVLASAGLEPAAASAMRDAIEDWKDADDDHRLEGAEAPQYQAAGYRYGPVNAPFRDISELRLVYGMTADLYIRLRGLLTVDSGRADVDLMASPQAVLDLQAGDLNDPGADESEPAAAQPGLPLARAGGFVFGAGGGSGGGLRVHVEVPMAQGRRYVTEATLVLDNRLSNGFRIEKWHEAGVIFPTQASDSRSAD